MEQEKLYVRPEMRITRFTDDMFTVTTSDICADFAGTPAGEACTKEMQCAIDMAEGQNMTLDQFNDWWGKNFDAVGAKCMNQNI